MRKEWLGISLASLMLAACSTNQQQNYTAPPLPAYNGQVVEIPGIEPKYEPRNPTANNDYSVNGVRYKIVTDTQNFSQIGLASIYGPEAQGNRTASGEAFDGDAFTAAHPTLPIPSYVRVTNLANNRQIVVRINDRGPFIPGRIIDLSPAAATRLNTSNNSRVRIDVINVAPDGTLSGPGTIGTRVAKQSYDLPARPDLDGGMVTSEPSSSSSSALAPVTTSTTDAVSDVRPVDNSELQNNGSIGAPIRTNGLQGAPQPLRSGVLESDDDTPTPTPVTKTVRPAPVVAPVETTSPHTTPAVSPAVKTPTASNHGTGKGFVVQVAAVNNSERANELQKKLAQHYNVAGHVEAVNGNIYRVQLGGYPNRSDASALQHRLAQDNINSFITSNNN
ncbi:endolytic peptidoglycan transglycosylase RlpA [Rosenbergiella australiborealis]|uniref:Endolytic peptidoglycan transglycosylase RlpA n=1 Tax=Rosenbergiella australiborealis TaxID=1544696 RepID=A0ABS5T8I7_9GAMM|nr:endolytic peptidoglycan transglycosylase RlpA [Rosenbergiella australiborealis]MBT0728442.1 endolytic peptidoglycan transglycosylase RlpA [Rosenbergiella australiborealis]